jgi:hypothetical protein
MSAAMTILPPPIKQCACGAVYTADEWTSLEYVGPMDDGDDGELELRQCDCNSTIAIQRTQ